MDKTDKIKTLNYIDKYLIYIKKDIDEKYINKTILCELDYVSGNDVRFKVINYYGDSKFILADIDDIDILEIITNNYNKQFKHNILNSMTSDNIEAILSREELEIAINKNIIVPNKLILISITAPSSNLFKYKDMFKNSISLQFWDIEYKHISAAKENNLEPISDKQAKQIIEFIKNNIDNKFIIHCEAGISRSAAVGAYIECLIHNITSKEEYDITNTPLKCHYRYTPNSYVLNTLLKLS